MLTEPLHQLQALSTYIDGNMKRYSLLFAVNGGAFAIGKLLAQRPDLVWGALRRQQLAIGAIIFTGAMIADIYFFGQTMKKNYLGDLAFGLVGKFILFLIGLLIIVGWALAALCDRPWAANSVAMLRMIQSHPSGT